MAALTVEENWSSGEHWWASWDRGAIEKVNGLVRQYIPKNRDFALVTEEKLIMIKDKLNHRPRKCLGF